MAASNNKPATATLKPLDAKTMQWAQQQLSDAEAVIAKAKDSKTAAEQAASESMVAYYDAAVSIGTKLAEKFPKSGPDDIKARVREITKAHGIVGPRGSELALVAAYRDDWSKAVKTVAAVRKDSNTKPRGGWPAFTLTVLRRAKSPKNGADPLPITEKNARELLVEDGSSKNKSLKEKRDDMFKRLQKTLKDAAELFEGTDECWKYMEEHLKAKAEEPAGKDDKAPKPSEEASAKAEKPVDIGALLDGLGLPDTQKEMMNVLLKTALAAKS